MPANITDTQKNMITNILSNARVATDDEIVFYLQSKTKLQKQLLEQIVANERASFSENSEHSIDFNKYQG
ncbi:hypothetical protein ACTHGU_02575 [Chitinophagaceae bacterium MMS25-I14]